MFLSFDTCSNGGLVMLFEHIRLSREPYLTLCVEKDYAVMIDE